MLKVNSLLPTISKILEKLLATRLIEFLTKNKILSKDQFGFRAKFSTEYAIVDIYNKLIKNLDEGLSSCAIFIDLVKAFDYVSHLNVKKSEFMLITNKHNIPDFCVKINDSPLEICKSYKYLQGVKKNTVRFQKSIISFYG